MPGSSIGGVSEEEKKKSSSTEDRGRALGNPVPQRSRPTVEGILTKAQFSNPLLYQIHCIEPVGFEFAHIYNEMSPPNQDPTTVIFIYLRLQLVL